MFVIELIYKATLAEIDATMKAHVVFLKKYYAAGNFLVSGRRFREMGASSSRSLRIESKSKRSSARIRSFNGASRTFASSSFARVRRQTTLRSESKNRRLAADKICAHQRPGTPPMP